MFDFEKCLNENGFVVDFDYTESTAELMNIEDDESWYEDYYEALIEYARAKRLTKYVYSNAEGHADIFFAKDLEAVTKYILDNYYDNEGDYLKREDVESDITMQEPLPTIAEILEKINVRNVFFSEMFGIPSRTLEDWKSGKRKVADYTVKMIVELLRLKYHYDEIKDIKEYY